MKTLDQWLAWQQRIHPRDIELGLDRVREVWRRLGQRRPAPSVITVGGTNGKGSTVALLEAMLRAAGHAVGSYTSPHLQRYNERIRLCGMDVDDVALVDVFGRIEDARGDVTLTYFEYGTLAALELMADATLDVAVLEVGLGGRLDAVNIVDADVAIVTSIGIDHVDWLGPDRNAIGREKAGIFRAGKTAIIGETDPPQGLLDEATRIDAQVQLNGRDFGIYGSGKDTKWRTTHPEQALVCLTPEALEAPGRRDNLASALAALYALSAVLGWQPEVYGHAAASVHPQARMARFVGATELLVDVAHNPQAATALGAWLGQHPVHGRTFAVFGALADKDIAGIAARVGPQVDAWHVCPLPDAGSRALPAMQIAQRLAQGSPQIRARVHESVDAALRAALREAGQGDRVLAFGSFHLAGAVLGNTLLDGFTRGD